jgi:hypothetical protein
VSVCVHLCTYIYLHMFCSDFCQIMSSNYTFVLRSGAYDQNTPAMLRDADLYDPNNAWMIKKMEEAMTLLHGLPMHMVKRNETGFAFSSHMVNLEDPVVAREIDLCLAAGKEARIAAEEKDKGIIRVTCWNCNRCFCTKISVCGRCSKARYCSGVCQRRHWPQHAAKCPGWKRQRRQRKNKK